MPLSGTVKFSAAKFSLRVHASLSLISPIIVSALVIISIKASVVSIQCSALYANSSASISRPKLSLAAEIIGHQSALFVFNTAKLSSIFLLPLALQYNFSLKGHQLQFSGISISLIKTIFHHLSYAALLPRYPFFKFFPIYFCSASVAAICPISIMFF